jgi:pimeloyl-ACP methyl ester carboxylesterase
VSALADHHRGGEGPPLLLIHGFTATWRTFGPVRELLEEQFDVLAPTLPGHTGGPPLPGTGNPIDEMIGGLEAMLDEVGWERPHVAGFSLGGQLTLELAERGRAASATAICPSGAHGDDLLTERARINHQFRRNHGAAARLGRVAARLAESAAFRRISLRDMMVDGSRVPAADSAAMTEAFAATPVFGSFLDAVAAGERELEGLERIHVPVTIVWGDSDRVLPAGKHERFFRERLPDARFITLKRAGHVLFWDAPERFADAVAQTALHAERKVAA